MSDCEDTLQELYRFLDGELREERRVRVQSHLDGCLDCLQAFDFHAELRIVIARTCRETDLPESLAARLEACFGPEALEGFGPEIGDDLGRPDSGR